MKDKDNEKPSKALYLLMLIPVFMFGILGAGFGFIDKDATPLSGFLWGIGIGAILCIGTAIWMFGWEWIKKEAGKGKLLPFMLVGFLAAIAISGYLAINLGSPSCEEQSDDPVRGGCVQYADDGYEATSEHKWEKFWGTLPVTVIITSLIAYIVRNEMHKKD